MYAHISIRNRDKTLNTPNHTVFLEQPIFVIFITENNLYGFNKVVIKVASHHS